MSGLFSRALEKQHGQKKKVQQGTVWHTHGQLVGENIKTLIQLTAQAKIINNEISKHEAIVREFAENCFATAYGSDKKKPQAPMYIQNDEGERVTFVLQDRSGQYALTGGEYSSLCNLFGAEITDNQLVANDTKISFNQEILALPGVQEAVEYSLEFTVSKLVADGKLTKDQSEQLVVGTKRTVLRPKIMDRLLELTAPHASVIKRFLDVIGSHITRFIKV